MPATITQQRIVLETFNIIGEQRASSLDNLASPNHRQCYMVLLCADDGNFYIITHCFKLGSTFVRPISR